MTFTLTASLHWDSANPGRTWSYASVRTSITSTQEARRLVHLRRVRGVVQAWVAEGQAHVAGTPLGEREAGHGGDGVGVGESATVLYFEAQQQLALWVKRPWVGPADVLHRADAPNGGCIALAAPPLGQPPVSPGGVMWVADRGHKRTDRLGTASLRVQYAVDAGGQHLAHLPGIVVDLLRRDAVRRQGRGHGRCRMAARCRPAVHEASHELRQADDVEGVVLEVDQNHIGPRLGHLAPRLIRKFAGPHHENLLAVGNQHKWDRLGPEKIIIMKSCVGAP